MPNEELDGTLISFSGPQLTTMITLAGALKLLRLLLPGSCTVCERLEAMITHYVTKICEAPNETAQVVASGSSIPFDEIVSCPKVRLTVLVNMGYYHARMWQERERRRRGLAPDARISKGRA